LNNIKVLELFVFSNQIKLNFIENPVLNEIG